MSALTPGGIPQEKEEVPPNSSPAEEVTSEMDAKEKQPDSGQKKMAIYHEPRGFMYSHFLHHPGLTNIQYKTFFHMCRLEGISFDMESRSGSTFCLFDALQSGVIGMLTIGVHRRAAVSYMTNALSFIQN